MGYALSGKNIKDFADSVNRFVGRFYGVKQGFFWRLDRKIVAVRGAGKIGIITDKGAGNYAAYRVVSDKNFASYAAIFIKRFGRHNILVRRNLENAVGGGVYD